MESYIAATSYCTPVLLAYQWILRTRAMCIQGVRQEKQYQRGRTCSCEERGEELNIPQYWQTTPG